MVSQGNETCRLIPQTSFRLAGQAQPDLPNGQTPQIPVSFKAVHREEKHHVRSSTMLINYECCHYFSSLPIQVGM